MKTWMKWTLGILGVIVIGILILVAVFWSSIKILSGTQELAGDTQGVPLANIKNLPPLSIGDTDWITWLGAKGDITIILVIDYQNFYIIIHKILILILN